MCKYGIKDVKEIIHNPSYDVLFAEETKPGLEGFEKGQVTELGAVNVSNDAGNLQFGRRTLGKESLPGKFHAFARSKHRVNQ